MARQLAFFVDSSVCTGCKTCQIACKDRNDLPRGLFWRRVYEVVGGGWERLGAAWQAQVIAYNLSIACNHCQEPACVTACPALAIRKREDGIVLLDASRCVGCRYCEWACPYDAICFDSTTGVASKCSFCVEAIDGGGVPACVGACPQRALEYGDLDDLKRHHGEIREVHPLPAPAMTGPALIVRPHRVAQRAVGLAAAIANWEEV